MVYLIICAHFADPLWMCLMKRRSDLNAQTADKMAGSPSAIKTCIPPSWVDVVSK